MSDRTLKLSNGQEIPFVGLGTWQSEPGKVTEAVKCAIDNGYRHIDCASLYGNEAEVGEGLKAKIADGTVTREEMFITGKLWSTCHSPENVRPALEASLKDLGLQYIDLCLIHWPFALKAGSEGFPRDADGKLIHEDIDYLDTWKAMEELVDAGLVKSIGVSNFNSQQVQRLLDNSRIKPVMNQVECHPYFTQEPLVKFCQERGVAVTAYSPFASPERPFTEHKEYAPVLGNFILKDIIGPRHYGGKTPAQMIVRWLMQRNIVAIPKSVTPSRIAENIDVFDFKLNDGQPGMGNFYGLHRPNRLIWYGKGECDVQRDAPYYPFNIAY